MWNSCSYVKTGGSPECVDKESGIVVNNVIELAMVLKEKKYKDISLKNCIRRAKKFDAEEKYEKYILLYDKHIRIR